METSKNRMAARFLLAMLACAISGSPAIGQADQNNPSTQPSPRDVVQQASQEVLTVLRDKSLSADQKRDKVKLIAYDNIDFVVMSRLCLGRFWRGLTDDQKAQYQDEFRKLVTNTYGHLIDDYTDQDVKIISDRAEQDGDWTVETNIIGTQDNKPNQVLSKVDYRLRNKNNPWKMIDITIEGASLVSNYRSQFQEIMSNGGIDQLLKQMHDKNAANDK